MSNTPSITKCEVLRADLKRGCTRRFMDEIAVEISLAVYIDGRKYSVLLASPMEIRELIIGYLMTEDVIRRIDEVSKLEVSEGRVDVHLRRAQMRHAQSGSKGAPSNPLGDEAFPVRFTSKTIVDVIEDLNSLAEIHRRTGGVHVAALADESGSIQVISEDISRYSVVDKIVGKAALRGLNMRRLLLALTGRVSSGIATKAASMGITVIASMSAPTDKGVKVSSEKGITLVGFACRDRLNIYSHPERIIIEKLTAQKDYKSHLMTKGLH